VNALPKGVKMQAFGAVLVLLCGATTLLSRVLGFELDGFYVAIGIAGAALFAMGALQKHTRQPAGLTKENP
jgi:branched-subunit amino acid transport protein